MQQLRRRKMFGRCQNVDKLLNVVLSGEEKPLPDCAIYWKSRWKSFFYINERSSHLVPLNADKGLDLNTIALLRFQK